MTPKHELQMKKKTKKKIQRAYDAGFNDGYAACKYETGKVKTLRVITVENKPWLVPGKPWLARFEESGW